MSFAPEPDKAVLYIYRSRLSDFQGVATSVDIGDVELTIFPNCVHRSEESPDDLQINHQIRVEAHLVA